MLVYTIGHSTRPYDAFRSLLRTHGVVLLADVRSFPGSRRCPQYDQDALRTALAADGIAYTHLPSLGGRRTADPTCTDNLGWRSVSFRGYADWMQGEPFAAGVATLLQRAARRVTAVMCAEAVPWRCHRQLLADALVARGVSVYDLLDGATRRHTLTPFARLDGARVTYPAPLFASLIDANAGIPNEGAE